MPNKNNKNIFQFLAKLLHPDLKINSQYFKKNQSFWDELVLHGSAYLLLPAIFGAIRRKEIQNIFPDDLLIYLEEISNLNFIQNKKIKKQIIFISDIFNKYEIEHVFLKGAALLFLMPYDVTKERMIGDIDILVSKKHILKAQRILHKYGFINNLDENVIFTKNIIFFRHMPRLVNKKYISAVELHYAPIDNNLINQVNAKSLLKNKVKISERVWIPNMEHLWEHSILNWQYNDDGMALNFLSLRTVLDVLYLEPKDISNKIKYSHKSIKHFYSLLSHYFDVYPNYYPFRRFLYKVQLNFSLFNRLIILIVKIKRIISIAFSRIKLF